AVRPRGHTRRGERAGPALRRPGRGGRSPPAADTRRGRLRAELDRAQQAEPRRRLPAPDRALPPRGGGMTASTAVHTAPTTRSKGSNPMQTVHDTWLIFRRSVILTLRQPTWLLFGIMYPVLYLVLFGPLLDNAVGAAGGGVSATN